jgi:hypothetical protein
MRKNGWFRRWQTVQDESVESVFEHGVWLIKTVSDYSGRPLQSSGVITHEWTEHIPHVNGTALPPSINRKSESSWFHHRAVAIRTDGMRVMLCREGNQDRDRHYSPLEVKSFSFNADSGPIMPDELFGTHRMTTR